MDPTMDAAAEDDTTLEFDPVLLRALFDNISPYIVGIPYSPGVIVSSTHEHDLVAVHTELIYGIPDTVMRYSDKTEANVDAVVELSDEVTILFAKRKGEALRVTEFANLDHRNSFSEKVVSFFPYMDSVAMFKGHIVLKDARSSESGELLEPLSDRTFSFTCPFASVDYIEDDEELELTREMTLGAPVYNLSGELVGLLSNVGDDYNVKFARNAEYLDEVLQTLWGENANWLKVTPVKLCFSISEDCEV
ncbi:hypothetical protein ACQ4PT_020238 [Festuca glaucescens]